MKLGSTFGYYQVTNVSTWCSPLHMQHNHTVLCLVRTQRVGAYYSFAHVRPYLPYVRKYCVRNSSYSNRGINRPNSRVSFTRVMPTDFFLPCTHIMKNLLCAQHLALDCLSLTPIVTHSQLWGHWRPTYKSSLYFILQYYQF